jgi:hypothetical protein
MGGKNPNHILKLFWKKKRIAKYYWKKIKWNLTIGWDTHTHVQKPWIITWMYWLPTITFQSILLFFTNGWGFMLNINQHTIVLLPFRHYYYYYLPKFWNFIYLCWNFSLDLSRAYGFKPCIFVHPNCFWIQKDTFLRHILNY